MELGNLDSKRDWGYAKDYVECMWMILQHDTPEDFVIATGEQHTVRDFTEKAFAANGIELRWEGEGLNEKGYDKATGKMLVCVNPAWFRPTDVDNLWVRALEILSMVSGKNFFASIDQEGQQDVSRNGSSPVATSFT